MRKLLLLFILTQITFVASAQVSVNVDAPGSLSLVFKTKGVKPDTIKSLTVTGIIDARDFKTMRDDMPALAVVDLGNAYIEEYGGTGGTADAMSSETPIELASFAGNVGRTAGGVGYSANVIPNEAFSNRSNPKKDSHFTSITLPSTITSIGGNAFYRCNRLTSVTIPNSVKTINNNAFYNCSGLTTITLPEQLVSIGMAAFSDCTGLKSIYIPGSLISIGSDAFSGTSMVLNIDKNNPNFSSTDSVLFNKSQTILIHCPTSKKGSYSIPETVTTLGVGAFKNCNDLSEIIIPNSVKILGASAFYGCKGLTSIAIPNSVTIIDAYTFYDCSRLKTIDIPNSVKNISSRAFFNCSSLTSVTIPNSLTYISPGTFQNCIALTSVVIPDLVTLIAESAFAGCTGLRSVTIPKSLVSIGSWAFSQCTALNSVTIPRSLSDIGRCAFNGCGATISVEDDNATYSSIDGVLFNKKQTVLIQCPTSKKGSYTIPNTVTSIYDVAFVECVNLSSVIIPKKIKSIDRGSFAGSSLAIVVDKKNRKYSDLDGVLFDKKLKVLMYCPTSKEGTYVVPNSVSVIDRSAFSKCTGLTSIIIPKSVKSIGVSSFNDCSGLRSITVNSSLPVELIPFASSFYNVNTKTCTLYVPLGSKALYQTANQWGNFENIVEQNSD